MRNPHPLFLSGPRICDFSSIYLIIRALIGGHFTRGQSSTIFIYEASKMKIAELNITQPVCFKYFEDCIYALTTVEL
jgi:hypothetical protein